MKELYKALADFQAELIPVVKSATNPFFKSKYAPLHEVVALVNPILAKHHLAVLQPMSKLEDGTPALTTIVVHESGESIEFTTPLFLVKEDPQSHGSAVTYARRYGLMSMLGIVADEDDDGNKATKAKTDHTKSGGDQETLARAKTTINMMLEDGGYDNATAKLLFIKGVLKKETIDTLNDADSVADALDNEKGQE